MGHAASPAFISIIVEMFLAGCNHFDNARNMKQDSPIASGPDMALEIAASKFSALGSEQRLNVLRVLVRSGPGGMPIGALGKRAGVTGSTLTHHLRILAAAGLVTQERDGRSIICAAAAYNEVRALSEFLLTHCCADCAGTESDHG